MDNHFLFAGSSILVIPVNVAIPTALIGTNDKRQLKFTFYVQLSNSFVSKEDLQLAVQVYADIKAF